MQVDFGYVKDDMFVDKLEELVNTMTTEQIMAVPGVYECMSEHLHNEVIAEFAIEEEHIGDMFDGFVEFTPDFKVTPKEPDNILGGESYGGALVRGEEFLIEDIFGDGEVGTISIERVWTALTIISDKYPKIMETILDQNDDYNTYMALFQMVGLGEIVYG